MFSENMENLGKVRSAIRELFEYGNKRKSEIGAENVFDFSLGNPSIPAPKVVNEKLVELLLNENSIALHGYTSAQGDACVRSKIAENLNSRYNKCYNANSIYITTGAAAALAITFKAISNTGDEIIVLAPFFPEYKVFIENAGAKTVICECDATSFQIDFDNLSRAITEKTKAIVINSPCNPTGVVFSKENIIKLCDTLNQAQEKYGHPIFIVADEPYREIVYDNTEVAFIPDYYDNCIVCYSFSKSLSLPGERIGYILVNDKCVRAQDAYAAVAGAGRSLGYVCAPSLFQKLLPYCLDLTSDISVYEANRNLLCESLKEYGYEMPTPDGAFYLFIKSLEADSVKFCENAKKFELLLVPSDSFGIAGYARISYCVAPEMIKKALPAFKAFAEAYKNGEF